jgi:hypothetical protein
VNEVVEVSWEEEEVEDTSMEDGRWDRVFPSGLIELLCHSRVGICDKL